MKYEVITDSKGYCLFIRHTGTLKDYVELDLDKYDLSEGRLNAYKLGKNELIFDDKRYKEILAEKQKEKDQEEVSYLKQLLNESDYIFARWGEEIIALNNPLTWVADVIKINLKYMTKYKETIENRKKWRERIEKLDGDNNS